MMNGKIGILLTLGFAIFFCTNAFAGDMEKGTISVGVSSNILFNLTNYSGDSNYEFKGVSLSAEMGYFFIKNWQIGTKLRLSYWDYDDDDSKSYSLMPFIGHHWVLNETSNLYARVGAGYDFQNISYSDGDSSDHTNSLVFGELGYEYFLTTNIAIDLGIQGERVWTKHEYDWSYEHMEDDHTRDSFTTQLKLKLYF
jgi:hypothetical protein